MPIVSNPFPPPRPPAEAPADAARLARRIGEGDRRAEEQLVERFARPVRLLLARHTRRPADAEDLFQETFRLTIEKLRAGELRQPEKLPGFVAALARNLAIEVYRKADRRRTDADSEHVAAAGLRPAQLGDVLERENASLVRRLLGELRNARDREILYRFYLAEEDKETIAADLELDSLQFNRVLHRARGRYRELLVERLGADAERVLRRDALVAIALWTAAIAARGATFGAVASLSGWRG